MRSYFKPNKIEIGNVKVGLPIDVVFKLQPDTPPIKEVNASCGCSRPVLKSGDITVRYTPQPIPKQLEIQGFYYTTKKIQVIYEDDYMEELTFKSKVYPSNTIL